MDCLDICKKFEEMKEKEQKLADCGYKQFKPSEKVEFVVEKGNTDKMKVQAEEDEKTLKEWEVKVKEIYG